MDPSIDPSAVEARLARLEEAHHALLERTAALEAENRQLRATAPPPGPTPTGATGAAAVAPATDPSGPAVGRRHLLRTGLAAAGAAATGAVLLDGAPAAAADGDPLLVGEDDNTATTTTTLAATTGTGAAPPAYGLAVTDGSPVEIGGERAALVGLSGGGQAGFGYGLIAAGPTGAHVKGTQGVGLRAEGGPSGFGAGVVATATGGADGVHATTQFGNGVYGRSEENRGVRAESGTGQGLLARSDSGIGVMVSTFSGLGLRVEANRGRGAEIRGSTYDLFLGGHGPAPTADTFAHQVGELVGDGDGRLWICTVAGTPGEWRILGGHGSAGAFHVLPNPVRAYDSRPGTLPEVGVKEPINGTIRTVDLNASGVVVPADATAALVTVLLVNAAAAAGNFTIWAGGRPKPSANTLVWGGSAGRFTTSSVTALTDATVRIHASHKTHVVLDVVGFYR